MSTSYTHFTFSLQLSADEYQRYYRGSAHNIIVMSHQGVSVKFPASSVRSFVTAGGVQGDFIITMDNNNKFVSLKQIVS